MKIIPVVYAKSTLPESECFNGGDFDKKRPILFMIYLLKTDNRLTLVDAGCETMPGFVMEDFIGPVKALGELGISPKDITDVIITHAHHDHIECVKYFPNANIYIQNEEYKAGNSYIPEGFRVVTFEDEIVIEPGITVKKSAVIPRVRALLKLTTAEKQRLSQGMNAIRGSAL